MDPLQARIRQSRIILDEPTDLPEGEVIALVLLDQVLAHGGDYLDDEDRAALHRELEASIAEAEARQLVDGEKVLAKLRARRSESASVPERDAGRRSWQVGGEQTFAAAPEARGTPRELDRVGLAGRGGALAMVMVMQRPLRARVRQGRIVLDEPTDLPAGDVALVPVDEVLARSGDYLDDEYRAALHRSIEKDPDDFERGDVEGAV